MQLNASTIGALFRAEMRMLLRDRRIMVISIVLPLLVMPILLFGSTWSLKKREQKLERMPCRYAVSGTQTTAVRALLAATRDRLAMVAQAKGKDGFKFDEVTCQNAEASLDKGEVHMVMEGLTAEEHRALDLPTKARKRHPADGKKKAFKKIADPEGETAMDGALAIRIVFRLDRDDSVGFMDRMTRALEKTRQAQRAELLKARGFPLAPEQVVAIAEVDVASTGQVAGLALGRTITLLVLMFILMGGAVVATDSLAGEKERGTLETLLTTAASRIDIITAKHLSILAVALIITGIQTASLLVYVGFKLIPVPPHFSAAVPPSVAVLLFILFLPMAALATSVLLLTSGYAKSYKEAQLYFLPVFLLGLTPALAPLLPGLPLRSAIVLVPVANIALAAKEILIGAFDWPMIIISWLVTAASAWWVTRLGTRLLSAEKLITSVDTDAVEFAGGPALFDRHVLRWFALLWGALVIVNNYLATADIRVQLLINLVGLFFGSSLAMIGRYRLSPRTALALRAPKPIVWLGVLLAIPSGLLTGIGLFRLANLIIPVPQQMIEGFSEAVIPENIPLAQLLLFLAVMPGIFEEIAFRGLLLHGLHRRLHPAALALVVGLVFGGFHFALFRLVPTAFLGVMLAAVTMLTGSIFPAMLWHASNNAIGILSATQPVILAELDPVCYLAGAGILALAFWIIWRNRTPYPGLRPWSTEQR